MALTEQPSDHPIIIKSLSKGSIQINDQVYTHSLILTADLQILPWDGVDFTPLLEGSPEVVLIGTGDSTTFLLPERLMMFYDRGIGVEVMTTSAAVHTYTILTSEDRKVSAGLII